MDGSARLTTGGGAVGPWLRAAQAAWLALVLSMAAFYAVGLATELRESRQLCPSSMPGCTEAAARAEMARLGVNPAAAYALGTALPEIAVPVGCLLIAGFLFWQRPDRLIVLALAAALALYGPWINTSTAADGLERLGWAPLGSVYDVAFILLLILAIYTFPTGAFVPRWAWLPMAAGLALHAAWSLAVSGGPLSDLTPITGGVIALGLGLQVYRYRRVATPSEQQQTKWVLAGLLAFFLNAVLYVAVVLPAVERGLTGLVYLYLFAPLNFLLVLALPVTLVFASLRYRLWDIDVLIRRTLIYSTLTVLLALAYLGLVVALQTVIAVRAGNSALATVLSTLAIAALFAPLRRWVQSFVDRRFYRRKYDAARALAGFAAQARDQVDLDTLNRQLRDVVDDTLQPAHVSLWLKQ